MFLNALVALISRNPLQEKSGRIDYHELKVAIRALGFDIKKAEALRLVEEHDVQGSGTVGLDDFLTILTAKYAGRDPEEELRKAFELFDAVCGCAWVVCGPGDQHGQELRGGKPARHLKGSPQRRRSRSTKKGKRARGCIPLPVHLPPPPVHLRDRHRMGRGASRCGICAPSPVSSGRP